MHYLQELRRAQKAYFGNIDARLRNLILFDFPMFHSLHAIFIPFLVSHLCLTSPIFGTKAITADLV